MIAPAAAAELVPPLRLDGLRAAGLYPDAQTDDARLCLANLRGAADAGAAVVNRVELDGLERGPVAQLRDTLTGETFEVGARAVVNAAGPWIDDVRRLEDRACGHVGDAEPRRAPRARARRRLGRSGHDPDRPDARRVRRPLGGTPPGRDDGRRLRGRRPRDRADRGRGAADPRGGRTRPGCRRTRTGRARASPASACCRRARSRPRGRSARRCSPPGRSGWSRSRAGS